MITNEIYMSPPPPSPPGGFWGSGKKTRNVLASSACRAEEERNKSRCDLVEKLFSLHDEDEHENASCENNGCDGNGDAACGQGSMSLDQRFKEQEKENLDNEIPQKERVQLKRMRKRQENALVQAERERADARSFAAAERSAVAKWANDQRSQIDKLRKQVKKEQLLLQKTKHETAYRKKKEAELEALRATIEKLKIDGEASTKRFRTNEARLRDRTRTQTSQIQQLKEQLTIKTNIYTVTPMTDDKSVQVSTCCEKMNDEVNIPAERTLSDVCSDTDNGPDVLIDTISVATKDPNCVPTSTVHANIYRRESFSSGQLHVDPPVSCMSERRNRREEGFLDDNYLKESYPNFEHGQETMLWLAGGDSSSNTSGGAAADAVGDKPPNLHQRTSKLNAERCDQMEFVSNDTKASSGHKRAPMSKTEHNFPDGRTTVLYGNGTYKEIHPNGQTTIRYTNGDVKTSYVHSKVEVYYYANANVSELSVTMKVLIICQRRHGFCAYPV